MALLINGREGDAPLGTEGAAVDPDTVAGEGNGGEEGDAHLHLVALHLTALLWGEETDLRRQYRCLFLVGCAIGRRRGREAADPIPVAGSPLQVAAGFGSSVRAALHQEAGELLQDMGNLQVLRGLLLIQAERLPKVIDGRAGVAALVVHVAQVVEQLRHVPGAVLLFEPFDRLLRRAHPTAAINGTFFGKDDLRPVGEGQLRHSGRMGTVLAISPDNRASIRRVEWGRSQDWSGYETVLGCGPTLVKDRLVDVRPAEERFQDPHVLGRSNRSAAGLTPRGKLVLVSIPSTVTLGELAGIMRALGCDQAMNLDGGASMAMYYRGKVVMPPGRRLANILTVYEGPRVPGKGSPAPGTPR